MRSKSRVDRNINDKGFALAELLVALAIASVLTIGIGGLFVSVNRLGESHKRFEQILSTIDQVRISGEALISAIPLTKVDGRVVGGGNVLLTFTTASTRQSFAELSLRKLPNFESNSEDLYLSILTTGTDQQIKLLAELKPRLEVMVFRKRPIWLLVNDVPAERKVYGVRLIAELSGVTFPVLIWSNWGG